MCNCPFVVFMFAYVCLRIVVYVFGPTVSGLRFSNSIMADCYFRERKNYKKLCQLLLLKSVIKIKL